MANLDELSGRTLGEFVLRERIDEGGFGTVYRARQRMLGRDVVVKVLHQRLRTRDAEFLRFEREAQLASRLDHPYAAHIYAFGVEETEGLVWIAMELVQGVTLNDWLRDHGPMSLEQLVPFFERIAEVVQAAHDRSIVHRDLKPQNIMVVEHAGRLVPKLLDFGVAKLLEKVSLPIPPEALALQADGQARGAADPEKTPQMRTTAVRRASPYRDKLTPAGEAVGSPAYMAPEQWSNAVGVGPATDVYALGIIGYEALTGKRPFRAETLDEYPQLHCLASVPPLGGRFAPSLDHVFERALAKQPDDRWSSALEFATALRSVQRANMREQVRIAAQQWQDRARPRGLLWRDDALADLERWTRRAPPGVLGELEAQFVDASRRQARRSSRIRRTAVAVAAAGVLAALQYGAMLRAEHKRRVAEEVAERTITVAEVEQGRQALLHGEMAEARAHLSEAYRRGERSDGVRFMLARAEQPRLAELARLPASAGRTWSAAFSPDGSRIVTTDDKAAQIWDASTYQRVFTLPHGAEVYQALYSRDGTRLLTIAAAVVRVWNAVDGTPVRELQRAAGAASDYYLGGMSPDGRLIAAIDASGAITDVWDAHTGLVLAQLRNEALAFPSVAFSADGHWLATGGGSGVQVVDTRSWQVATKLTGPGIHALSWDPTGPRLLTGSTRGDASIWSVPNGHRVHSLRAAGESVDRVAYAPNGELVVTGGRDGSEQVWNAASGELHSNINVLAGPLRSVAFDPTSSLVVAAGGNTVAITEAISGMPVTLLEGARGILRGAYFDALSRVVVGASWDGTAHVWNAGSPYRHWTSKPVSDGCGLVMSHVPDERFIAVRCGDQPTQVWDTARNELLARLPSVTKVSGAFASAFPAVSNDGRRAAIARGNTVEVYELPGGRMLHAVIHRAAVNAVAFADEGRDLISGDVEGGVLVTQDNGATAVLPPASAGIDDVRLLVDGRAVTADAAQRLRVLDIRLCAVVAEFPLPTRTGILRVSPDRRRLVVLQRYAGPAAAPVLFDLGRYQRVADLDGHVGQVFAARFISSGRELITAGADGTARTWDSTTGRLVNTYQGAGRILYDATVSPDGTIVVGGATDGALRFWDASNGRTLWALRAHRSHVVGLHYEGGDVVTRAFAGDISRWSLPNAKEVITESDTSKR